MNTVTFEDIEQLRQMEGALCVSVTFPTDPVVGDPRANSIVCKNLLNQALDELGDANQAIVESIQKFLETYSDDAAFWKEVGQGFALYATSETLVWYKLPVLVPESVMIASQPYLVPLLSSVDPSREFYVLKLDKDDTQLWGGRDGDLQRIEVADFPTSVEDVTGREQNERQLQSHASTSSGGGAIFHGNSSWQDDKDRYLEMFLHAVDRSVLAFFKDHQPLLFLSGVEESVVLYRQISKYKNIHATSIPHNDKSESDREFLGRHVQPYLEELDEKALEQHLNAYIEEPHQDRKLIALPDILNNAFQGKVATLYVAENEQVWGVFDPNSLSTVIEEQRAPTLTELLNEAVGLTLKNSGKVVMMPRELMPEDSQIAAVLRF